MAILPYEPVSPMDYRKVSVAKRRAVDGFSTYCFAIRSCLEQDLQEHADVISAFMERNRDRVFSMYSTGVPAAAAFLMLEHDFEASEYAW